jgi:ribonuclease P/MRP protein subunit POP1
VVRAVSATAAAQLPAQLDVASQLAAHETQISALQRAMKTARAGASTRAWQSLPRAERRRAASHNLLALPARLRARGRAEMAASTTTPRSRSETRKRLGAAGKNGGYPRTNERERRAEMAGRAGKPKARWLETHLWHAKRFRMSGTEPKIVRHGSDTHGGSDAAPHRWGFSLAEEPHMKGHRAAARTVSSGAAVHDASYTVSLRLSAHAASGLEAEAALKEALRGAGVGDAGHRDRATDSVLLGGPSRTALQAPVRVLWVSSDAAAETPKPQEPVASQAELAEPHLSDKALGKRRASVEADIEVGHAAEVILLIHPAGLASLQSALELSLAALDSPSSHLSLQVLESASPEVCVRSESKGRKHGGAKKAAVPRVRAAAGDAQKRKAVEQQRQQGYNVFELCGPHCGRVLGGVLQPLSSTSAEKRQVSRTLLARACAGQGSQRNTGIQARHATCHAGASAARHDAGTRRARPTHIVSSRAALAPSRPAPPDAFRAAFRQRMSSART